MPHRLIWHSVPVLLSADTARTIVFYAPLGFELAGGDAGWISLRRGDVELLFAPRDAGAPGDGTCYLRSPAVDRLHAQYRAADVPCSEIATRGRTREFTVTDPDGNVLRFGQPDSDGD